MNEVLITLGSNLQKETNVAAVLQALGDQPALQLKAVSPLYETVPIGSNGQPSAQPSFYNGAVLVETELPPAALRNVLRTIEAQLGRVRSADKFAPRPIDLDIAVVRQVGGEGALQGQNIDADPAIMRFIHLSAPLADLAPDWIAFPSGETLRQIAEQHWAQSAHPPRRVSEKSRVCG